MIKYQIPNTKYQTINKQFNVQKVQIYDLEERTLQFAKRCRDFINQLPKTIPNIEYSHQLARSSGSPAANYIEANESLSKKDFSHRIKICRKESKESKLWLLLCESGDKQVLKVEQEDLIRESIELTKIFNSIAVKNETQKHV